jgi:hypothetical protein
MHLCVSQIVSRIKNQLILDFVLKHKFNACFVTPKGKKVGAFFVMDQDELTIVNLKQNQLARTKKKGG